ncbi:ABC transporter ATP-binding protein/permease [Methylococcus mesophilus]|uniref:ABC transporter ATP-binding protein/permease n=1 Tax=Methylococcus mesophilus TaxID=2993564 RepID=UPI00224B5CA1|nr:SbmA/BacA-like family transporter [Methylococcus mesophilus]UZR29646.1 ABC transporter ATP-binding protein/permease [Methylococcus mesophilus]
MMNDEQIPLDRLAWERFKRHMRVLLHSEVGGKALGLFLLLIVFLVGINGLNVVNSYVGRDFMTAIAERNRAGFVEYAWLWIGVFAVATVVSVVSRYMEESLALLWRTFLAQRSVHIYATHRVYFYLEESGEIGNPDQRIADDIKTFTTTTLSFTLMLINGSFTVVAFSGVLWSISPLLMIVAVLYAALGTYCTVSLGRPLVKLNFDQLDKEADFRSGLIYLKENADAVALSRREIPLLRRLQQRLAELAENFRAIVGVNRNVGFFATFYNWMIQIIPALFVAPMFIRGDVEFGVITQSAIAFTALLGAFSLIVTQFQSISSFAAVLARLSSFSEAVAQEVLQRKSPILASEGAEQIVYLGLTLRSPRSGRILVENLTVAFSRGERVLVRAPDESARTALLRVTAGLWDAGEGGLMRPALDQLMFVTERPFLPFGSLQELLLPPHPLEAVFMGATRPDSVAGLGAPTVMEEQISRALAALGLGTLSTRFGGLAAEQDWSNILPLAEQQLLVIARLLISRPRFALLDRPAATLSADQLDMVLNQLSRHAIAYVVFAEDEDRPERYDAVLELKGGGTWEWKVLAAP